MTTKIKLALLLNLAEKWWFWAGIFFVCVVLEAAALFYQHVLNILPCELCIYVRVWIAGIALLSLFAMVVSRWVYARITMCLAVLGLSLGLAMETWNLIVVEYNLGSGSACSFFANFPAWAPLDKWMPALFEVQELCQATPEILWGFTMAHGLALVSIGFIAAFIFVGLGAVRALFSRH